MSPLSILTSLVRPRFGIPEVLETDKCMRSSLDGTSVSILCFTRLVPLLEFFGYMLTLALTCHAEQNASTGVELEYCDNIDHTCQLHPRSMPSVECFQETVP